MGKFESQIKVVLELGKGHWDQISQEGFLKGRGAVACFFFKAFYFILEYSQLTMLWGLQVDSKGPKPYIYMYPFSPKLPPIQAATEHGAGSLCYTAGLWWLSILNIAVCVNTCQPQT